MWHYFARFRFKICYCSWPPNTSDHSTKVSKKDRVSACARVRGYVRVWEREASLPSLPPTWLSLCWSVCSKKSNTQGMITMRVHSTSAASPLSSLGHSMRCSQLQRWALSKAQEEGIVLESGDPFLHWFVTTLFLVQDCLRDPFREQFSPRLRRIWNVFP